MAQARTRVEVNHPMEAYGFLMGALFVLWATAIVLLEKDLPR